MLALFLLPLLAGAADVAETPVAKVVRLLTDMKNRLETEAKTDAELYDQLACWCETNKKDKDAATETAEKQISGLTNSITELAAKSAELKANIARLEKEVAANQDAMKTASAIRSKENGEFTASEQELLASQASVSGAVESLKKHHSFLQVSQSNHVQGLKTALANHGKALAPSQRRVLSAFLQQPAGFNSYNSRSGEIFGILEQMKETFTNNLSAELKDEQTAQQEFNQMESAKNREIGAAKQGIMDKTAQLAETDEAHAHAKHDLELTRKALSIDQKFLIDLNDRCTNGDAEYAERTKLRNTELAAVGEAVAILTDDSARDLFSSSLGSSFIEKSEMTARKRAAVLVLQKAGAKATDKVLMALAASAGLNAFAKVQESINNMVVALKTEMKDEIDQQRFCVAEIAKNEKSQANKKDHIDDLNAAIDENKATVDTLAKEIQALKDQVTEMNVQIKRASEDREKQNQEFQQTVADQRATAAILGKVMVRLGKVYSQVSLVQSKSAPGEAAPPPPANFKAYEQDGGGGGVLSLIQQIIAEAGTLEKESLHAEQTSQTDYQRFVNDSAKSIEANNRAIAAKSDEKAELEGSIVADSADRKSTTTEVENLAQYNGELHLSCDYVLNNFESRQSARAQEVDALNQAKAILSGASFS